MPDIQPTGIIRTLPTLGDDSSMAWLRYHESLRLLERGRIEAIQITMPTIPRLEVLHMYLLIDGQIDVRLNISGYKDGTELLCWDGIARKCAHIAICTGPVSYPPMPIKRRGFQGFRYTEELW